MKNQPRSTKDNYSSKCFDVKGSNNVHCVYDHFTAFGARIAHLIDILDYYADIMLNAFANLL